MQPAAGSLRRNGGSEDAGCSTSAENDSVRKEIMDVDGSDDDQNEGVGLNATLSSPRKTQRKRKLKLVRSISYLLYTKGPLLLNVSLSPYTEWTEGKEGRC